MTVTAPATLSIALGERVPVTITVFWLESSAGAGSLTGAGCGASCATAGKATPDSRKAANVRCALVVTVILPPFIGYSLTQGKKRKKRAAVCSHNRFCVVRSPRFRFG